MRNRTLLDQLIQALCCLPGVGTKSAQRMAYDLLERKREAGKDLGEALVSAMANIKHCNQCKNFTEYELCHICSNPKRDHNVICIVESPADVSAIENAAAFSGTYFVLMGHLSPLDGIGPEELELDKLVQRLQAEGTEELILATGSTMEGEATAHYIRDMVESMGIKVSRIAQGVPMGGELEYIDSGTLARSINERRLIE